MSDSVVEALAWVGLVCLGIVSIAVALTLWVVFEFLVLKLRIERRQAARRRAPK